jgi:CYTH domain-containing protein
MEIERKFWVKSNKGFEYYKSSIIKQYYINKLTDFYEIRLRYYVDENRYYLEFKSPGNMIREEFGTKITKEQFDDIIKGINPDNYILKIRYYTSKGFFDEYQEDLKGLQILEIEGDEDYVKNYVPNEEWDCVEVTYDDRFKNRNLIGKTYQEVKKYKVWKNTVPKNE